VGAPRDWRTPKVNGPDFLLIGAQKAGTSSLWTYLRQHPDLFLPAQKEPHFFCGPGDGRPPPWRGPGDHALLARLVFDPEEYAALFAGAGGRRRGEASTMYLNDPDVPARVVAANPAVRVVVMLRDPVTRAHSAWWMWRRARLEPLDFVEALAAEPARLAAGWSPTVAYDGISRYAGHLARWREAIGADRFLALRSDALRHDRLATVQSVFAFLGVDPTFVPTLDHEANDGSVPGPRTAPLGRHPLRSLRVATRRLVPPPWRRTTGLEEAPRRRPPLDSAVRERLRASYADDVARTEAMLGWDLPDWR